MLRHVIRERRKLSIANRDAEGRTSARMIQPIVLAYYVDATAFGAHYPHGPALLARRIALQRETSGFDSAPIASQ